MRTDARNIVVLLAIAIAAAMVGVWLWYAMRAQDRAVADAQDRGTLAVALAEESMRDTVRSVDLVMELIDRTVAGHDLGSLASDKAITDTLIALSKRLPDLRSMWLADPTGKIAFGTAPNPEFGDPAGDDFFRLQVDDLRLLAIAPLVGKSTKDRFIPVSRRLERAGKFSGVLLAALSPAWFQRFGRKFGLADRASVTFVTPQGGVVVSTAADIVSVNPILWKAVSQRLSAKSGPVPLTIAVASTAGSERGGNVLVSYRSLPDLKLVALYAVPFATVLQGWSRQIWVGSTIVGLAVVVIIGGAALIFLFGQRQGDLRRVIGLRTAEAAQAAERLALAVDTTGIGIFDYRMGGTAIAWAGVEASYFGLQAPPVLTPRALLRAVHPADRRNLMRRLRMIKSARDDTRFDTEFRLRHPQFGAIWVAARAKLFISPRNGRDHEAGRLIGTLRDITERRLLQEHRETVLREINHRIKNSLQLMNSIMNLQARRISSVDERGRFEAARRRLISLATVYAHLDDTTRPDVVDLAPFLRRLCQDFGVAYMADGRINLSFSASGDTRIAATLAVPLGMAVGEILVNISLNGGAPQSSGTVVVSMAVVGDQVEIAAAYDGSGAEQAFSGEGAGLGRLLINAFVDQLGGTFAVEDAGSCVRFRIGFRVPPLPSARPMLTAPATTRADA